MKFSTLLLFLRQQLVDGLAVRDRDRLITLKMTFSSLVEAAYQTQDEALIALLTTLEDVARDGGMGIHWKSDIPSVETILSVAADTAA